MVDTRQLLENILGHLPQFELRAGQVEMVRRVSDAMEQERSLIIEAGTGSGKSFGYLVPALLQRKRPIVVSTGTIALQEQLLNKDVPFLQAAMGLEVLKVKLVKGRSNYVCLHKLEEALADARTSANASGKTARDALNAKIHLSQLQAAFDDEQWSGDRANLDWSLPNGVWEEVSSTSDDCLGRRCGHYEMNPYRKEREHLDRADVLITNHALYCQDLASGGALLPPHDIVIFDEAHHLKTVALQSFTVRIGKYTTTRLLQKIRKRLIAIPESMMLSLQQTEAALMTWLFQAARKRQTFALEPDPFFRECVESHIELLDQIHRWVGSIDVKQLNLLNPNASTDRPEQATPSSRFNTQGEVTSSPSTFGQEGMSQWQQDQLSVKQAKLLGQLKDLRARWQVFLEQEPLELEMPRLNWVEVDNTKLTYELRSTPLRVAQEFKQSLWPNKTAILTSATLTTQNRMDFFREQVGLDHTMAEELVLHSPFETEKQAVLYLPQSEALPDDPNHPDFAKASAQEILNLLRLSQGRAFVLFTSYHNMIRASQDVIPNLVFPCKMQGDMPRKHLIDWFKETPHSVLFATATYWEGIDIPGDDLSLVIMDKIPFNPPDDPIHAATIELLKREGKSWFEAYALPQAILKLKQGFGRLLRTQTDTGVVVILDPRMRTKGYGKKIQRSLPPVPCIHRFDAIPTHLLTPVQPMVSLP